MYIENILPFERGRLDTELGNNRGNSFDENTLLLMPPTARGSTVSSPANYFMAYGGINTINISDIIEQIFLVQIPPSTETQVRQTFV